MQHLYARMPDGTTHDFGEEKAAFMASLPHTGKDQFVRSLITCAVIAKTGPGSVGEFLLDYELREEATPAEAA